MQPILSLPIFLVRSRLFFNTQFTICYMKKTAPQRTYLLCAAGRFFRTCHLVMDAGNHYTYSSGNLQDFLHHFSIPSDKISPSAPKIPQVSPYRHEALFEKYSSLQTGFLYLPFDPDFPTSNKRWPIYPQTLKKNKCHSPQNSTVFSRSFRYNV